MDDNIVRHYSHESTFVIEMTQLSEEKDYEVILTEIDTNLWRVVSLWQTILV